MLTCARCIWVVLSTTLHRTYVDDKDLFHCSERLQTSNGGFQKSYFVAIAFDVIAFGVDAIFPEDSDAKVNGVGDSSRGSEWVRLFFSLGLISFRNSYSH